MDHRRTDRKVFSEGYDIGSYKIVRLIGQGGYGDVYECEDTTSEHRYAIKVEMLGPRKQALEREYGVMRTLDSPYFPKYITYHEGKDFRFLVMECLGPSLSAIRRVMPEHCFCHSTVLRIGIEMLRAIQTFHEKGFLHRDIKPSNFLVRASRRYPVTLTDYGLSRRYKNLMTGELEPPRPKPGFVGTSKYASLNAHDGRELGRRDDLMSWFYSLIELWDGQLPWSGNGDKRHIGSEKQKVDIQRHITSLEMPPTMCLLYKLIRRMERDDEPDYELMMSMMCKSMEECGSSWKDTYEWETMDLSEISTISLTPCDDDTPIIPQGLPDPILPPRPFIPLDVYHRRI